MQVRDKDLWEEQRKELIEDGEVGQKVLEFMDYWLTTAEEFQDNPESPEHGNIHAAFNRAFDVAQNKFQHVPLAFLANMLVIVVSQWSRAEDLYSVLTPIELSLFHHGVAVKMAEMEQTATENTGA